MIMKQKSAAWLLCMQVIPLVFVAIWTFYIVMRVNDIAVGALKEIGSYFLGFAGTIAFLTGIIGIRWQDETNKWYKPIKFFAVINLWISGLIPVACLLFVIFLLSGSFSA